jgi:hypothetical protein
MRTIIAVLLVLAPLSASAQPAGSAAPTAGSAAPAAAGSADAPPAVMPKVPEPAPPSPAAAPSAADLRQTCAAAMNADPTFAESIVETINKQTLEQHKAAASAIAKNEKHVILAYAAFWMLAALFVVFLWRRQQGLKAEIAQLKRDLDAASKS